MEVSERSGPAIKIICAETSKGLRLRRACGCKYTRNVEGRRVGSATAGSGIEDGDGVCACDGDVVQRNLSLELGVAEKCRGAALAVPLHSRGGDQVGAIHSQSERRSTAHGGGWVDSCNGGHGI